MFILGLAVPHEASETMAESCLWALHPNFPKIAIYCNSTWYNVHTYTTEELVFDLNKTAFPVTFLLTKTSKDLRL
jgi:hypothetical protein